MKRSAFGLDIDTVDTGGRLAVSVTTAGEVDVTNAAQFAQSLDDIAGPRPLILDLSSLRYLDSAGFAVVLRLVERQAVLIVLASQSLIHKAATLIGLTCYETVDSAIDEWNASLHR